MRYHRPSILGRLTTWLALGTGVALSASYVSGWFGTNFHVVIPGKVYRSAQPNAESLAEYHAKYGIKTVINLRGASEGHPWYDDEARAADELGMKLLDIDLHNSRLPPLEALKRYVSELIDAEKPVLVHGRHGADRAAMAASIARLLHGESLATAREEYAFKYGYLGMGLGDHLPSVVDLYESWLTEAGGAHSPQRFRTWVDTRQTLYYFGARIDISSQARVVAGRPSTIPVVLTNTSDVAWPGDSQPMRLEARLIDSVEQAERRWSMLLERRLYTPGERVELDMTVPAIPRAGSYICRLGIDDGGGIRFGDMGPFDFEDVLEVRESSP